jgi:hypothetical protein
MARNGQIDGAAFARRIPEGPPGLALAAGVKKPETGIEPASVATANNTPIPGARRSAMRRMAPTFAA